MTIVECLTIHKKVSETEVRILNDIKDEYPSLLTELLFMTLNEKNTLASDIITIWKNGNNTIKRIEMTLKERAEKAVRLKVTGGYNCSQAVSAALVDQTDLDETNLKHATAGFCAGMGNLEATCGALIGAVMIAGLNRKGDGTLKIARRIQETFKEKCGAIKCKDLKTMTDGKPLCPCEECVRNAVMIYGEIMGLEDDA